MKINVPVICTIFAAMAGMPQFDMISLATDDLAPNIALGKKVTALPVPNSGDSGNRLEALTDGNPQKNPVESQGSTSLWVQPTATGWSRTPVSCLIVDLESVHPISGFSYHTAAGVADVTWPGAIFVLVSDDQNTWKYAGDLVALSAKRAPAPPYGEYHEHTFLSRDIQAKGRYVAFGITSSLYTVTDEIEVFAGEKTWLAEPDKNPVLEIRSGDLLESIQLLVSKARIEKRVDGDLKAIKSSIQKSSLPQARKEGLLKKIGTVTASQTKLALPATGFRAILPLNDAHRRVLKAHGEFLGAQGFAPLTIWNRQRFEWLDFLARPDRTGQSAINFSMLGNQFRSQALLLTNATGTPQTVKLRLNKMPQSARSGWLQIDEVVWTDTFLGVAVPDALIPAQQTSGTYSITVPAGVTRKIWLTVDSSKLSPGRYQSELVVDNGKVKTKVAFKCDISSLVMKRPRLSLGMWDETDGIDRRDSYSLNAKNYADALKLMRSHYVDTAWGTRAALPWPGAEEFHAEGNLKSALDFSRFEAWAKDWPNARHFFVFINAGDNFAGEKIDTPLFNAKVGSWAQAIVAYMRNTGRDPKQIGFLLVDESRKDETDVIIAAWSRAINAVAPELVLFSDPLWLLPDQVKHQESLTNVDILSPNLHIYQRGGEPAKAYYEELRRQGKELWFYQCDGPTRLFDPQRYFRYQAWHTFAVGGKGQGFWSFGDAGQDSWNEYAGISYRYAPVFVDQNSVTNSIHWDAVREGVTDFEELAMLRDAMALPKNAALRTQAQKVLDAAVQAVTGIWKDQETGPSNVGITPRYDWQRPGYDAELADRELKKVRLMLERLS